MRTVRTICIVIALGALAALPFKKGAVPEDTATGHATGPVGPTLGNPDLLIEDTPYGEINVPSLAISPQQHWPAEMPGERKIKMPLTYAELAMPVEQLFSADPSPAIQSSSEVAEAADGLATEGSRMQPAQLSSGTPSATATSHPSAAPSILVSSPSEVTELTKGAESSNHFQAVSPSIVEPLPPSGDSTRKRYWIRQP